MSLVHNWGRRIDLWAPLSGLDCALSVRLLSHQSNDDYLFKLVDEQGCTGLIQLHTQLGLTARAAEVLYWVANGKTNKEIGEIRGMSSRTVNKHLEQVYPALGGEIAPQRQVWHCGSWCRSDLISYGTVS